MKKFLLGAGVVASVSIGSIVFTGGDIINQVNTKVAGMFDMLSKYESNETTLVEKINDLKTNKLNLEEEVRNLRLSSDNKDNEILSLNDKISKLEEQIEILQSQLGDSSGLTQEIIRLEGEINKANNKVAELQSILDTEIINAPLTNDELEETLMEFNGVLTLSPSIVDNDIITLSDYAKLTIDREDGPGGGYYRLTVESTTMDSFGVEFGCFNGEKSYYVCHTNQPVEIIIYASQENPYQYLKVRDVEFTNTDKTYKLVVE